MTRARDLANIADGTFTATDLDLSGTLTVSGDATFDTNTLFVDVSANAVGVGTTSPQKTLDVTGTFAISNSTTSYWDFDRNDSDGSLTISDTGSEKVRLDISGNVGIGVTPSAGLATANYRLLEIGLDGGGSVYSGSNQTLVGTNIAWDGGTAKYKATGYAPTLYNQQNGVHTWSYAASGTAGNAISFSEAMRIASSGNVGIGTTASGFNGQGLPLVVGSGSGNTGMTIYSGATGYGTIQFADTVTTGAGSYAGVVSYNHTNDFMYFSTAASERMRINSSGNLLVGTTSVISGTNNAKQYVFNNTASHTCFQATAGASHTGIYAVGAFSTVQAPSGSNVALVVQSGNGSSVTFNNFFVYTNGDVKNTNNSYGGISDIKLKENVVDASPKLEKLNQVRVVNYNLIGHERKQIGVIAQELEQVFPGMVDETPDRDADGNDLGTTTKSVKYSVFVPMLIKAIQEQQEIINDLRARVAQLEGA